MGEESHRLHDILPLLVALNGETEERERGDGTGEDKSSNLARVDICVVRKYVDHVRPRSVRHPGAGRTPVEHFRSKYGLYQINRAIKPVLIC